MKKYLILFVFSFFGFVLFAQATDTQIKQAATTLGVPFEALKQFVQSYQVQTVPAGTIEITAKQLYEEYSNNEVKADSLYKGKTLRITGKIYEITKNPISDVPQIGIKIDKDGGYSAVAIFADFVISQRDKIVDLTKEQTISFIGICRGKSAFIDLEECRLVD